MAPELALRTFENRQKLQAMFPPTYLAEVTVAAILPDTKQSGEFALKRRFVAPKTLQFTPVKFTGDGFVKSNVIARLLQSEVDHVARDEGALTAINEANYKFSYKGVEDFAGTPTHVFHTKPRQKRPGLFKGRILVDVSTGELRRVEGTLVKSPSFFIKKVEFVQDYTTVGRYTFPIRMHSTARTRLVGRAVVDITTSDYRLEAPAVQNASTSVSPAQTASIQ